jgi:CelD/BcsL family acetyltransferase involved in cellulose biosynthesis
MAASVASPGSALRSAHSSPAAEPGSRCSTYFATITDRAEFDALEEEWNALFERAGRPHQLFQGFNWLRHWANHYLDSRLRLSIVVGHRDGRLSIVWPLVAQHVAGLKRLSWMGEPVSQ